MASLGHVAVGLAAARFARRRAGAGSEAPLSRWPLAAAMAGWSLVSFAPDADIVGLWIGIPYGAPWGHRGATHSLAVAVLVALAAALVAATRRRPVLGVALLTGAVVASHPLLDMLTDGGLGCALLWPLDDTRYFAPWNPIPVAPVGLDFISRYGLMVAIKEAILFAPVLAYGLWPRRRA